MKTNVKDYSDTFLYNKGSYEKGLFDFMMHCEIIDKNKPVIEDKELSNSLFCDLYEDGEPGLCSELSGYEKFPLWKDFYEKKESGMSYSRNESARCYDFLKNSWYKDIPIMSEALSGAMPKID